MMRLRYERPPIRSVSCEFEFRGPDWDLTYPGFIYEKVQNEFPLRKSSKHTQSVFSAADRSIELQTVGAVEFLKEHGHTRVLLRPYVLTILHDGDYEGWEKLRPLVDLAFGAYTEVAEPDRVLRARLHYRNEIFVECAAPDWSTYFAFFPQIDPGLLPVAPMSFIAGVEVPVNDQRDILRIRLTDLPGDGDNNGYLLDVSCRTGSVDAVPVDEIASWLEQAHSQVVQAFEHCITDRLRDQFGRCYGDDHAGC